MKWIGFWNICHILFWGTESYQHKIQREQREEDFYSSVRMQRDKEWELALRNQKREDKT